MSQMMIPGICALIDVHTFSRRALAHTLVSIIAVHVLLTSECVVTTPGPGGASPPAAGVTWVG